MNDIKTLYNACSDKDELAQIAEKLNIDGNANLATVLNKIVDAIPKGGVKIFPIEIHTVYSDGELSSYRCSHTFAEIVAALNDGYIVVANGTDDNGETVKNVATLVTSYDNYGGTVAFGYSAFNCSGDTEIEPLN